jgi:shikimate dehydrogenase
VLRGADLPANSSPSVYQTWLRDLRSNSAVAGAVITSHKLAAFDAGRDLFADIDLYSMLAHEVNAISSHDELRGFAREPLSLSHLLPSLTASAPSRVVCFGAGGAATALLLAYVTQVTESDTHGRPVLQARRPHLVFVDVSESALSALVSVARRCGLPAGEVETLSAGNSAAVTRALDATSEGDLVVNATGLGKEAPDSPVDEPLPPGVIAWDMNYRGPLSFLQQARDSGASPVDGWDYFVAGWAGALTAIASVPLTADLLSRFAAAAEHLRPSQSSPRPGRPDRAQTRSTDV